jgi:hypothetical protein
MTGVGANDLNLAKLNMLAAAICGNFGETAFCVGAGFHRGFDALACR